MRVMQQSEISSVPRVRQLTAARAILQTLVKRGGTVAYGLPGGLISPIFDALADVPRLRWVATRHEAMAGFAAIGHATHPVIAVELLTGDVCPVETSRRDIPDRPFAAQITVVGKHREFWHGSAPFDDPAILYHKMRRRHIMFWGVKAPIGARSVARCGHPSVHD